MECVIWMENGNQYTVEAESVYILTAEVVAADEEDRWVEFSEISSLRKRRVACDPDAISCIEER